MRNSLTASLNRRPQLLPSLLNLKPYLVSPPLGATLPKQHSSNFVFIQRSHQPRGESFEEIEEERKSSSHDRFPLRRSLGFESKHDSEKISDCDQLGLTQILVITNDLLDFSASAREILDDLIKFN
ncbi:hypothetical protein WN943_026981 [Citrus x changshan-huyou]